MLKHKTLAGAVWLMLALSLLIPHNSCASELFDLAEGMGLLPKSVIGFVKSVETVKETFQTIKDYANDSFDLMDKGAKGKITAKEYDKLSKQQDMAMLRSHTGQLNERFGKMNDAVETAKIWNAKIEAKGEAMKEKWGSIRDDVNAARDRVSGYLSTGNQGAAFDEEKKYGISKSSSWQSSIDRATIEYDADKAGIPRGSYEVVKVDYEAPDYAKYEHLLQPGERSNPVMSDRMLRQLEQELKKQEIEFEEYRVDMMKKDLEEYRSALIQKEQNRLIDAIEMDDFEKDLNTLVENAGKSMTSTTTAMPELDQRKGRILRSADATIERADEVSSNLSQKTAARINDNSRQVQEQYLKRTQGAQGSTQGVSGGSATKGSVNCKDLERQIAIYEQAYKDKIVCPPGIPCAQSTLLADAERLLPKMRSLYGQYCR